MPGQSCACPSEQAVALHITPSFLSNSVSYHCACSHFFVANTANIMAEQMIPVICVARVPAAVSALHSCT